MTVGTILGIYTRSCGDQNVKIKVRKNEMK